jgi:hypothetical protein
MAQDPSAIKKKPEPKIGPGQCWLVARINFSSPNSTPSAHAARNLSYALRRGLTVKSRTWVRMLDICIPFSCETNGKSSAMN